MNARDLIARHDLRPHPEGGWYRQTWAAPAKDGTRPTATAILFLLQAGERSHWHKVDADELWLYHAGAPLTLRIAEIADGPARDHLLGPDNPQIVVPTDHWQSAQGSGDYTLVSCIVSPGFTFDGFTLAPPDFDIPGP